MALDAPRDDAHAARLRASSDLVAWPIRNSLGYHFSMVADTTRNGCFDRAICRALAQRPSARSHVLDIGAGSGLLAMLAARHGAAHVSTVEMVRTFSYLGLLCGAPCRSAVEMVLALAYLILPAGGLTWLDSWLDLA